MKVTDMTFSYALEQGRIQIRMLEVMATNPKDSLIYASANLEYHLCTIRIKIAFELFRFYVWCRARF